MRLIFEDDDEIAERLYAKIERLDAALANVSVFLRSGIPQPEATTGLNPRLIQDANDQVEETT